MNRDEKALAAAIEHCDALSADDCLGVILAYEATKQAEATPPLPDVVKRLGEILNMLELDSKVNGDGFFRPYIEMLTELKPKIALAALPQAPKQREVDRGKVMEIMGLAIAKRLDPKNELGMPEHNARAFRFFEAGHCALKDLEAAGYHITAESEGL